MEALESCAHTGTSKHTLLCHQRGENNPVYEVKRERGTGRGRILHQNTMLPRWRNQLSVLLEDKNPTVNKERDKLKQKHSKYQLTQRIQMRKNITGLRHHHHSQEPDVAPPVTPEVVHQPGPGAETDRSTVETPLQTVMENDTSKNDTPRSDTQEVTQSVPSADLHRNQEPEPFETQPRRSQRDRRPRETLTYESLGQPVHRVVHSGPLYVNTLGPVYRQYGMSWALPQMWGTHVVQVPVGYY